MKEVWAYDLDGVLSVKPPAPAKKWGRMNGLERNDYKRFLVMFYRTAPKIILDVPDGITVITARKETPATRQASQDWLEENFPGKVASLHMLNESRSVEAVLRFKSEILIQRGATDFVEDNWTIVRGLRKALPSLRIWWFDGARFTLSGPKGSSL